HAGLFFYNPVQSSLPLTPKIVHPDDLRDTEFTAEPHHLLSWRDFQKWQDFTRIALHDHLFDKQTSLPSCTFDQAVALMRGDASLLFTESALHVRERVNRIGRWFVSPPKGSLGLGNITTESKNSIPDTRLDLALIVYPTCALEAIGASIAVDHISKLKTVTCHNCNMDFNVFGDGKPPKFCSATCGNTYRKRRARAAAKNKAA
ncbi:MAG: hypothetical protein ACRYGG_15670, partial [Janthinobacterium lividum]